MKPVHTFAKISPLLLCAVVLMSCSKDDDQPDFMISGGTSSFDELNMCAFSTGANGTEFIFEVTVETLSGLNIDGIEFDLKWSNENESSDLFEDDFFLTGDVLDFDWCFRFGSTDWFEIIATVIANDGEARSNPLTIRVNKPDGAN